MKVLHELADRSAKHSSPKKIILSTHTRLFAEMKL